MTGLLMTREEFQDQCQRLVSVLSIQQRGSDFQLTEWREGSSNEEGDLYLWHDPVEVVAVVTPTNSSVVVEDGDGGRDMNDLFVDQQLEEDNDCADIPSQARPSFPTWSYSILYNNVYQIPVLYFHAQKADGHPLTRQQVLHALPKADTEDSWDFISQEQHPATAFPSFFLHPCLTAEKLEMIMSGETKHDGNRLLLWSWMSMILPAVGHPIPSSLFLQIHKELSSQLAAD